MVSHRGRLVLILGLFVGQGNAAAAQHAEEFAQDLRVCFSEEVNGRLRCGHRPSDRHQIVEPYGGTDPGLDI
jgi:hypothetical protein